MVIEQYVPSLHDGDAVGNSALSLHRAMARSGVDCRLVALEIDEPLRGEALTFSGYAPVAGAVRLLHMASPSPLGDFFRQAGGKRVLVYHNITPAGFFLPFAPELARSCSEARRELAGLAGCFDLCLADSGYNAAELRRLGFAGSLRVFPLPVDLDAYDEAPSAAFGKLLADGRPVLLFVGRVSPNKKVDDLLKLLHVYRQLVSPDLRLIVAGSTRSVPAYSLALRELAARLGLDARDVLFTGHIPFAELLAVYRLARLFVSMSEHEGFCLPLIESCRFHLPVLAYEAGAVAETLGGAGILFREKRLEEVALTAERMLTDEPLRARLAGLAAERLGRYRRDSGPERLLALLGEL